MSELKLHCGKCGAPFPTHTEDCTVASHTVSAELTQLRAALAVAEEALDRLSEVMDDDTSYADVADIAKEALAEIARIKEGK